MASGRYILDVKKSSCKRHHSEYLSPLDLSLQPGSRKLSKEEKAKLRRLEQERKQREAEEARLIQEAEEARRKEREAQEAARRAAEAKVQERLREEQLAATQVVLQTRHEQMELTFGQMKDEDEWDRMMRCDGLPDASSVPEMNRYLSLWRQDSSTASLQGCLDHTPQLVHVISELDEVMDTAQSGAQQLKDWREIWLSLQETQRSKLDQATYRCLLDLRGHLDHETQVYSFFDSSPLVALALWSNTARSPKNNVHEVEKLGLTFTLPADLVTSECVVRVMRTEYDHYSQFARTFYAPQVEIDYSISQSPPPHVGVLVAVAGHEQQTVVHVSCTLARWIYGCKVKAGDDDEAKAEDLSKYGRKSGGPPDIRKQKPPHLTETQPGELNLRRYRVQGGVYTMDLLQVPPQPRVVGNCTITQVEDCNSVRRVQWRAKFNPPPPAEAAGQRRRDPEAIEQEMRQLEKELQKLLLITIKLPDSAFWFEPPQMVLWDEERGYWSSDFFHDVKYNEDQCVLQVRTTRLGVLGLAMNRFANLPFQNWELRPNGLNSAVLSLTAAVVLAEIVITEGQVSLQLLQDGARSVLTHLYGKFMKPKQLIKTLRFYGINLFPEEDSYCYIDGLPIKHRPTELHLYNCMSLVGPTMQLAWSRWNLLAGPNKLVFQMKKMLSESNQGSQELVLVTPQRTVVLECTEVSQSFSAEPRQGLKVSYLQYYADLYQLVSNEFKQDVIESMQQASSAFVHTINHMLNSSSVISYC
ncbi:dynein axonemal intermediate chain 7 homolog [Oratosquilla oratoria]|uniref:dynein axonemal intermediate chain 7 homolog n=1 Tax=Oratosquilla oratoria TaxID=337810 RepID=UPI003F770627